MGHYFVRYKREFVITVIVITEFDCNCFHTNAKKSVFCFELFLYNCYRGAFRAWNIFSSLGLRITWSCFICSYLLRVFFPFEVIFNYYILEVISFKVTYDGYFIENLFNIKFILFEVILFQVLDVSSVINLIDGEIVSNAQTQIKLSRN